MLSLIGNTPIIKLKLDTKHQVFAKCEFLNPTASIKDRVAKYIVEKLKSTNTLKPEQAIVECSSGNMGTSLAAVGQLYNHPVYITCPDKTGLVKRRMIEDFGANLTVCKNTTDCEDPEFYVNKAKQLAKDFNGIHINQYDNVLNTDCHYETTGLEIVNYFLENNLEIDYFITVGGSGGTVTGCAKRIKENFPNAKVIMPDPKGSVYYDIFYNGRVIKENIHGYKVEGPGNPTPCKSMDLQYIDRVIQFNDDDAFKACRLLAQDQGICGGHSSGANYFVVDKILSELPRDKSYNIVTMILDSGIKYNFQA